MQGLPDIFVIWTSSTWYIYLSIYLLYLLSPSEILIHNTFACSRFSLAVKLHAGKQIKYFILFFRKCSILTYILNQSIIFLLYIISFLTDKTPLQFLHEPFGKPWHVMFNALHVVNNNESNIYSFLCIFISMWYIILIKSMW